MKFTWSPAVGPLKGAFVFLSASVPDPRRHRRFLAGPLEDALMLRVIDRRVDDAVQSLLSQTLSAGGRIVHGGHPKITMPIAHQANQWKVSEGIDPPIRIYQSEFFRHYEAPLGRDEMARTGTGVVRWVPADLDQILTRREIPFDLVERHLPQQAPPDAKLGQREALLAMRIEMIIDSQPRSAICIGGMEGIEAEARLYLELAKLGRIPSAAQVQVIGSTYGASAQLEGEGIRLADQELAQPPTVGVDTFTSGRTTGGGPLDVLGEFGVSRPLDEGGGGADAEPLEPKPKATLSSTPQTAQQDLQNRISYDGIMRSLVARIASTRS
jgi:hypothetical protein